MGDHGKRENRSELSVNHMYTSRFQKRVTPTLFIKVQRAGRARTHMRGTEGKGGRGEGKREKEERGRKEMR